MKYLAAVMTGAFLSLSVFSVMLNYTSCSLGDLFVGLAVAYAAGISAVMFIPEKEEKNDNY